MDTHGLHQFYEFVVLPQFGIEKEIITWKSDEMIGYDDDAHYFDIDRESYADQYCLLFRDYGGFNEMEIQDLIRLPNKTFSYKTSKYYANESHWIRFTSDTPFKYVHNITGYFTLIKID
jgi:hypothetical protein